MYLAEFENKNLIEKTVFSGFSSEELKKAPFWSDFDVATLANAFPQPFGRHNLRRDAPLSGLSPGYRGHATPIVQSTDAPRGNTPRFDKRRTINQKRADFATPVPPPWGPGSPKPCAHEGRPQQIAPASGQDAMCMVYQRNVRQP